MANGFEILAIPKFNAHKWRTEYQAEVYFRGVLIHQSRARYTTPGDALKAGADVAAATSAKPRRPLPQWILDQRNARAIPAHACTAPVCATCDSFGARD